jgi:glycosidase
MNYCFYDKLYLLKYVFYILQSKGVKMKKILGYKILLTFILLLIACTPSTDNGDPNPPVDLRALNPRNDIYYQIFVRSFADSDGDGIGDFNGITQNLDYLEDLGVTAIWMMPFNETDLDFGSHHGYRIKDYYEVNSEYGTMADLENLINEADSRKMRVMMDLVINHVSDTHPWFVDARDNPTTSPYRDWFIWQSPSTAFETFAGGMKDLNLHNSAVVNEIKDIVTFWQDKGITGFRFDAAKHLFIGDPGTNPAQMATRTHEFLRNLQTHARSNDPGVYFLGEVFEYDYNSIKDYYIGLDSLFDFYVANEIWDKVGHGNNTRFFVSNIERAFNSYRPYDPNYSPSIFISNHDIDRIASFGQFSGPNGHDKLKLAASVTLTLPGSPHIYYGEELGMTGTRFEGINVGQGTLYDQYRRAPFIWGDTNKTTTWLTPYQGSDSAPSVQTQLGDPNSLLSHYKAMANLRKDNPGLMYGNFLSAWNGNSTFLQGYVRHYEHNSEGQTVLVIHNMSSTARSVDLQYLEILYGNLNIPAYGTLVLELDSSKIANYI